MLAIREQPWQEERKCQEVRASIIWSEFHWIVITKLMSQMSNSESWILVVASPPTETCKAIHWDRHASGTSTKTFPDWQCRGASVIRQRSRLAWMRYPKLRRWTWSSLISLWSWRAMACGNSSPMMRQWTLFCRITRITVRRRPRRHSSENQWRSGRKRTRLSTTSHAS